MKHSWANKKGFTIVELLIVIVIIAVLAAITVVAYNGIQKRAQETKLKADLTNAAKQMEVAYALNASYPTSFPADVKRSDGVVLSLSTSTKYCINAELTSSTDIRWYYDAVSGGLQEGSCSGVVIAGSESGVNPNLITNTDFSSGWSLVTSNNTGRTFTTRAGTTGDPYPSRPVLVLSNNSTNSVAYAVIASSQINQTAILNGHSYVRSYYVRKVGSIFTGLTTNLGVLDTNGANTTLTYNNTLPPTSTSWQKVTATTVATQNAPSSNNLYFSVGTTAEFTKSGWQLEFQGFELREQ